MESVEVREFISNSFSQEGLNQSNINCVCILVFQSILVLQIKSRKVMDATLLIMKLVLWISEIRLINALLSKFRKMPFLFLIIYNVYNYLGHWFSDFSVHKKHLALLLFVTKQIIYPYPRLWFQSTEIETYNLHVDQPPVIRKWVLCGLHCEEHWSNSIPPHSTFASVDL